MLQVKLALIVLAVVWIVMVATWCKIAGRGSREEEKAHPCSWCQRWGSDASAAGGGNSELSEWPRSATDEPASPGEGCAGHRNRIECNGVDEACPWRCDDG